MKIRIISVPNARNASHWHKNGGGIINFFKNIPSILQRVTSTVQEESNIQQEESNIQQEELDNQKSVQQAIDELKAGERYAESVRVRRNDSPTSENTEVLENRMFKELQDYLPNSNNPADPSIPYSIPYLEDKEIKVKGIGRVPTNALDSLAKYAGQAGIPLYEGLGLAAQETGFGAVPIYNYININKIPDYLKELYSPDYNRELGNSSFFRNFGSIPAQYLVRDFEYDKGEGNKGVPYDRSLPPLLHAFKYWEKGKYNPGDPNHTSDVRRKGQMVMQDPAIQQWLQESGQDFYDGKRSTGGPMYPYSFSKKQMPAVRFDDGGSKGMVEPAEETSLLGYNVGPLYLIKNIKDDIMASKLRRGKLKYNTGNQNIVDFFSQDYAPRYQRTNPESSEGEIEAILSTPSIEWNPAKRRYVRDAIAYSDIVNNKTGNWFNTEYMLSNPTIVHEDVHALRQGNFGRQYLTAVDDGEPYYASLYGHDVSGYTPEEQAILNDAYDMSDAVEDYDPLYERGTTNTELRYRMWRDWKNENGRTPSIEELDSYIDSLSDDDMLNYMAGESGHGFNAYITNDLQNGKFYSDEYLEGGYNRLKELDAEYKKAKYKRRKEIMKEADEIKENLKNIKNKYNFDKVKHALKNVAMNDSRGRYNDVESLGFA